MRRTLFPLPTCLALAALLLSGATASRASGPFGPVLRSVLEQQARLAQRMAKQAHESLVTVRDPAPFHEAGQDQVREGDRLPGTRLDNGMVRVTDPRTNATLDVAPEAVE